MSCNYCKKEICFNCMGTCCSWKADITEEDISRISKTTGLNPIEFVNFYYLDTLSHLKYDKETEQKVKDHYKTLSNEVGYLKRNNKFKGKMYCTFLKRRSNNSGYCSIYSIKPECCNNLHQNRCINKRELIRG